MSSFGLAKNIQKYQPFIDSIAQRLDARRKKEEQDAKNARLIGVLQEITKPKTRSIQETVPDNDNPQVTGQFSRGIPIFQPGEKQTTRTEEIPFDINQPDNLIKIGQAIDNPSFSVEALLEAAKADKQYGNKPKPRTMEDRLLENLEKLKQKQLFAKPPKEEETLAERDIKLRQDLKTKQEFEEPPEVKEARADRKTMIQRKEELTDQATRLGQRLIINDQGIKAQDEKNGDKDYPRFNGEAYQTARQEMLNQLDELNAQVASLDRKLGGTWYKDRSNKTTQQSQSKDDQYEVGKTYVDANGNKAKYIGNGQWQEQK